MQLQSEVPGLSEATEEFEESDATGGVLFATTALLKQRIGKHVIALLPGLDQARFTPVDDDVYIPRRLEIGEHSNRRLYAYFKLHNRQGAAPNFHIMDATNREPGYRQIPDKALAKL